MSTKHTPQQWEAYKPEASNGYWYVGSNGHVDDIVVYGSGDLETEAKAKLIAAAPEMLSALREIVTQWDKDIMAASYMMEVRDLIKKATE